MKLLLYENERYRRCAVIDKNNKMQFFQEEFKDELNEKGNIYVGKIVKLSKSLNAAFVDYGGNRYGFLSIYSIHFEYFNISNDQKQLLINKIQDSNLKNAYKDLNIEKIMSINTTLIVQVTRETSGDKGSMLSTFISLKGRFLTYIPNSCVSKIFLPQELLYLIKSGSIFHHTPCNNIDYITHDLLSLINIWDQIIDNFNNKLSNLLYINENFILKPINSFNIQETIIEETSLEYFNTYMHILPNVSLGVYIFRSCEYMIDNLQSNTIQLDSGGYIIITHTPACTTIDVNLGNIINISYNDAVLLVNKEASYSICNQMILRNISGIIIVDFIEY